MVVVVCCAPTWTAEDADDLAGGASIVGNGNDIAQGSVVGLAYVIEHVDEVVGSTSAGEDHDATSCCRCKSRRYGSRC